jgi:hypothetical protein
MCDCIGRESRGREGLMKEGEGKRRIEESGVGHVGSAFLPEQGTSWVIHFAGHLCGLASVLVLMGCGR